MSKTNAAYMRAYRARKKLEVATFVPMGDVRNLTASLEERIRELEAEVAHLKMDLAAPARGLPPIPVYGPTKNGLPRPTFRPVPKPGKK